MTRVKYGRPLAAIEHMGETFHVVREAGSRKAQGQTPFVLLHDGARMASAEYKYDLADAVEVWRRMFLDTFPAGREDYFRESLAATHERATMGNVP